MAEKFEENLKKLESIAEKLEKGDLPLEKSLELYEEGIKLTKICLNKLTEVEKKIEILSKDKDGKLTTKKFETSEDEE